MTLQLVAQRNSDGKSPNERTTGFGTATMGLTFATGGTAGNVEMIEVLTREVLGLGKPLFECGLNNV